MDVYGGHPSETVPPAAYDCHPSTPLPTLSERDQIRIEFYKTYDVMTGVRIAATLGGFFGLMVLLVVYKSKCKSRSISDEHLEAAVAAAVIEEEEELALNALNLYSGPRRSLGNMSAPTGPYPRFSSLGGHGLFNPPVCHAQRARMSMPSGEPRLTRISPPTLKRAREEEEEEDDDYPDNFLQVPSRRASRRLSSITCSSADSSYLERRGSAVEVGHPPQPPLRRTLLPHETWDFYYPIDIQVIQPTPVLSPCTSEGILYDRPRLASGRVAPLASISSCQVTSFSGADDCHSVGSDSVFFDEECMDTEDEAEEFSTDSDVDDYGPGTKRHPTHKKTDDYCPSSVPFAKHLHVSNYPRTMAGRFHADYPLRRLSSPSQKVDRPEASQEPFPSSSRSCDNIADDIANRPPIPLTNTSSSETIDDIVGVTRTLPASQSERPTFGLSCDHLVKALAKQSRLQTSSTMDLRSWSQETLF